jgi:hypothetical protein
VRAAAAPDEEILFKAPGAKMAKSPFSTKPRFDGHHRSWKAAPSYAQASAGAFWRWAGGLDHPFCRMGGPVSGPLLPQPLPRRKPVRAVFQ